MDGTGTEDHHVAGSKGRPERCSQEPVLGAANPVVGPTVRRAAGRVADNDHALVADPDPTLTDISTEISRKISRLGRRPLRRPSRPHRPAAVAGPEADADDDQVRIGGVAVNPVSAAEGPYRRPKAVTLTGRSTQPTPGPTRARRAAAFGGAAASRIFHRRCGADRRLTACWVRRRAPRQDMQRVW